MKYVLTIAALLATLATPAHTLSRGLSDHGPAGSCWTHNGSLMRLTSYENGRSMVYEVPSAKMSGVVLPGTELFNATSDGITYVGSAVFFSKYDEHVNYYGIETNPCPVAGPILRNGNRIVLYGQTGRPDLDTLVFDHSHQC